MNFNFNFPKRYVYELYIKGEFVGFTNQYEQKVMIQDGVTTYYFGVYATPELAYEGNTVKHSNQFWLKNRNDWKLKKYFLK